MSADRAKKRSFDLKKRHKDLIFYILLLAVPVTQFALFYIGINLNSILLAFKSYDFDTGIYHYVGIENFARVFGDLAHSEQLGKAVVNSFIAYGVGLVFGTGLSIFFSYYIYKKAIGSSIFKVILFAPSIVSSVVMVLMFKYFSERALPSIINDILPLETEFIGFLSEPETGFGTVLFFGVWSGFGTSVLLYVGAMNGINESVVEAAHMDGCGPLRELFQVTMPMIFPTFSTLFVVGIANIASNQINLYLFYGLNAPPSYYTIGFYMFRDLVTGEAGLGEYPYLAAMGLVMTAVVAPVTLVTRKLLNKYGPSAD